MIEDDLLVEVAQIVEHQAKNSRTRSSAVGQRVDLLMRGVDAETGARGAVHAQPAHQRLGAMMAGAHRDALPVEQCRHVVRVRAFHGEGEHAAAILRRAEDAQKP